jgi:hypothetical protein
MGFHAWIERDWLRDLAAGTDVGVEPDLREDEGVA